MTRFNLSLPNIQLIIIPGEAEIRGDQFKFLRIMTRRMKSLFKKAIQITSLISFMSFEADFNLVDLFNSLAVMAVLVPHSVQNSCDSERKKAHEQNEAEDLEELGIPRSHLVVEIHVLTSLKLNIIQKH